MAKVLIGGLSPEATALVNKYVEHFLADANVVTLNVAGLRGRVKVMGARADVMLIVLSDDFYDICLETAEDVLNSPKTHKYESLTSLNDFLSSKFGEDLANDLKDSISQSEDESLGDLTLSDSDDESYLPESQTVKEEPIRDTHTSPVEADTKPVSYTSSWGTQTDLSKKVAELTALVATKDSIISNLKSQIQELSEDSFSSPDTSKLRVLEEEISRYKSEVDKLRNESYMQLGKVAKAEQVLQDLDNAHKLLEDANADIEALRNDKTQLNEKIKTLRGTITSLEAEETRLKSVEVKYNELIVSNRQTLDKLSQCMDELNVTIGIKKNLEVQVSALSDKIQQLEQELADKGVLEARIGDLEARLSKADSENVSLQSKMRDYATLQEKVSQLSGEVEKLKDTNVALQDSISALVKDKESLDSLNASLTEELTSKSRDLDIKCTELSATKVQLSEMTDKANSLEDKVSSLNKTVADLSESITSLKVEKVTSQQKVGVLTQELSDKERELSTARAKVEELEIGLTHVKEELSQCEQDRDSIKKTLSETVEKLDTEVATSGSLRKSLEDLTTEKTQLGQSLGTTQNEAEALKGKCSNLESQLSALNAKVERLQNELSEKSEAYESARQELVTARQGVEVAGSKADLLQSEIALKDKKIEGYVQDLKDKDSEIEDLNSTIETLKASLAEEQNKSSRISSMQASLSNLQDELNRVTAERDALQSSGNSSSAEISSLSSKIVTLNQTVQSLQQDRDSLREALNQKEKELQGYSEKITSLEQAETSRENEEIASLRVQLSDMESQLTDEKRTSAKLSKELENSTLRIQELSSSLEDAKRDTHTAAEVTELKSQVEALTIKLRAKEDTSKEDSLQAELTRARSEVSRLQADLQEARGTVEQLKSDVEDKALFINSMNDNIFLQIANFALPKVQVDVRLNLGSKLPRNVKVFASATSESNLNMYNEISKIVSASRKRFLIVDLVTDTYIDAKLGVRSVPSPIEWLKGSAPVNSCIAPTKLQNVKVISTALGYFNEIYLLSVNWQKRLEELSRLADEIFFVVGCLDNVVHNVMFESLASMCSSAIVLKATPINIRTAILHLSGFKDLSRSTVFCTDYSESQSKRFYDKLAQRYQCRVLREADIITLGE